MSDPAIKACADALAAELALRALGEERDLTEKDHEAVEVALDTAAATEPTSYAGIADLAALTLEVEEPDPHVGRMLAMIRDAASKLAQSEKVDRMDAAENGASEIRGSTRCMARQRFVPGVKSNTGMVA